MRQLRLLSVRPGGDSTPASISGARDQFRVDLGGGTVAGPNGSFGDVRREINWDGTPDGVSAPNNLPANFFNFTRRAGRNFRPLEKAFRSAQIAEYLPSLNSIISIPTTHRLLAFSVRSASLQA